MIKGIIFDLDGTLLDSMYIWNTIGEKYLEDLGYEPEANLNQKFKNMSIYQAACYYIDHYDIQKTPEQIIEEVNEKIEDYYKNIPCEKKGVKELLETLRSKKIKMCIASATDRYLIEYALSRLEMSEYFSEIFTCNGVGYGKDKPNIYLVAMAHLGLEKDEVAIFEDAAYALRTAKALGVKTVGIYDEYEEDQAVVQSLSDYYLKDYLQLEELLAFLQI